MNKKRKRRKINQTNTVCVYISRFSFRFRFVACFFNPFFFVVWMVGVSQYKQKKWNEMTSNNDDNFIGIIIDDNNNNILLLLLTMQLFKILTMSLQWLRATIFNNLSLFLSLFFCTQNLQFESMNSVAYLTSSLEWKKRNSVNRIFSFFSSLKKTKQKFIRWSFAFDLFGAHQQHPHTHTHEYSRLKKKSFNWIYQ